MRRSPRPSRRSLGAAAEAFGAAYLEALGYRIQARNWRSPFGESDLIAEGEGWLRLIKVRAKRNDRFGSPEESLTSRKRRRLLQTALAYLAQQGELEPCWRADLASVTLDSQGHLVSVTSFENILGESWLCPRGRVQCFSFWRILGWRGFMAPSPRPKGLWGGRIKM